MPTKRFDALDVSSSVHTSTGNLTANSRPFGGPGQFDNFPVSSLISSPADGSFDILFNEHCISYTVDAGITGASPSFLIIDPTVDHKNTILIDYLKPITGLPDGCLVTKMVFRSPWSCNINYSATKTGGTYQVVPKSFKPDKFITFPNTFLTQNFEQFFGPGTSNTQSLILVDSMINAAADITAFDFTASPGTGLTRDDFVTFYEEIRLRLLISGASRFSAGDQLVSGTSTDTDNIDASLIYQVSFHTGWWIDVTYEEAVSWDLTNPPANRAVQPGDFITITSDPLDPEPLDPEQIETVEIALIDADGNEVGVRVDIPEELWTTIGPNTFIFQLPDFEQSVNNQKIKIYITSTQFTGSIELAELWVIYFYNAPGVYTLIAGRTHDTYYNRDDEDFTTVDTKIPDPTGRTGYY